MSLNQGKGIYLVRSPEMLKQKLDLADDGQRKTGNGKPIGRIIQKSARPKKFKFHKFF